MDVVDGPRRRHSASRRRALCAGLILTFAGSSAWAAACIPVQDLTALRAAALRHQLLVAATQCNRAEAYKNFVRAYDEPLRQSDALVLAFFKRRNPITGTTDYDIFKKALTSLWTTSSSKDNVDFCANADNAFRMVRNPASVPLQAVAANISTGRYVACVPGAGGNMASAKRYEPTKAMPARVAASAPAPVTPAVTRVTSEPAAPKPAPMRIADDSDVPAITAAPVERVTRQNIMPTVKAASLRAAPAAVLIKPTPRKSPPVMAEPSAQVAEIIPTPKPAMAAPWKATPVIAAAAAGPGIPLSQYAMTMGQPERSPYEATPEELMTEADAPLANEAESAPVSAPQVTEAAPAVTDAAVPAQDFAQSDAFEGSPNDVAREIDIARMREPYAEQHAADGSRRYFYRQDESYAPRESRYPNDYYQRADARYTRDSYYRDAPGYGERYASAPSYYEQPYERYGYGPNEEAYYDPYYGR